MTEAKKRRSREENDRKRALEAEEARRIREEEEKARNAYAGAPFNPDPTEPVDTDTVIPDQAPEQALDNNDESSDDNDSNDHNDDNTDDVIKF